MGFSATEALFKDHRDAVDGVQEKVQKFWERKKPFRVFHGSTNQTRPTSFTRSDVVDVSHLDHVLYVDPESQTCLVQPNVDMWTLVNATLEEDLLPPVVPEFPAITVGGAFNGTAGESSSWKHGFFDRSVLYVQIILADGRIVHCGRDGAVKVPPLVFGDNSNEDSPEMESENEEKLTNMGGGVSRELSNDELKELFFASIGAFGTLGVTTLFCLSLQKVEEGSHVLLTYQPVNSANDAVTAIQQKVDQINGGAYEKSGNSNETPDFIDGILFDTNHGVIMTGRIVAPDEVNHLKWHEKVWQRNFARPWNQWFYLHAEQRLKQATKKRHSRKLITPAADLIPIRQYLFRYDVSAFWMGKEAMALMKWPYNRITRMITYPFIGTRTLYSGMHLSGAAGKYVIQDFIMPADKPKQGGPASLPKKKSQAIKEAEASNEPAATDNEVKKGSQDQVTQSTTSKRPSHKSKQGKSIAQAANPTVSRSARPSKSEQPQAQKRGDSIILDKELDDEIAALNSRSNLAQGLGILVDEEDSPTAATNAAMQPDISRQTTRLASSIAKQGSQPFTPPQLPEPLAPAEHTEASISEPVRNKDESSQRNTSEANALEPIDDLPQSSKGSLDTSPSPQTVVNHQQTQEPGPLSSSPSNEDAQLSHSNPDESQSQPTQPPRNTSQATTLAPNPTANVSPTEPATEKKSDDPASESSDDSDDDDGDPEDPPASRMINYIQENLGIYPLWLCPILGNSPALMHQHAPSLRDTEPNLLINIGTWGPPSPPKLKRLGLNDSARGYDPSSEEGRNQWITDNRALEAHCQKLGGKKWLYAQLFYEDEDAFWGGIGVVRWVWEEVRERFGAGLLPSLWDKIGWNPDLKDPVRVRRTWGLLAVFGYSGLLSWA